MTTVRESIRQSLREQAGTKAERFVRGYEVARNEALKLSERGAKAVVAVIDDLRRDLADRLALLTGSPDDPFTARIVPGIQTELNGALADLAARSSQSLQPILAQAFEGGAGVAADAFTRAGVSIAFPSPTPALLTALTGTTQDILSETFSNLGTRIMREVRLSVAAGQSSSQTIRRIADALRTSEEVRRGIRRRIGIGFQAEAIARTETMSVYSAAQQASSERLKEQIPDLRKRWVTRLRERRGHRDVEEETLANPILVTEKYRVVDHSRTGSTEFITFGKRIRPNNWSAAGQRVARIPRFTRQGRLIVDRMLFPRDPAGSAGNRLNCTCSSIEVVPEMEEEQGRVLGLPS